MRKVDSRKVLKNLGDKTFRANRLRNRISIMAIALTAMLFTALFTMGFGALENFQNQVMRQSGGRTHGSIKNVSREQYETLKKHPLVKKSTDNILTADRVQNPEFLKRHMEMWYRPEDSYADSFIEIVDGRAPEQSDEILMDETSMKLLGLKPEAGKKVTLMLQLHMEEAVPVERDLTVCGVIKSDPAMDVGFSIVSKEYLEVYQSELVYTYDEDSSAVGAIRMDVMLANSVGIQDKLDQIIEESGYSTDESSKGNYIASNGNWAYLSDGAEADAVTTGAIVGGLFLILLTGYLIIYNVFQISVLKDIRYFGLLKTIGTTGRQIKRILRRQAMWLSAVGIPIGLFLGFFLGKVLVPLLISQSSYAIEDVVVSLNPLIFIGASAFSAVTVAISVNKPAKIAAKVSPVEAVRYTDGNKGRGKEKCSLKGGKLYRMALSSLGRNKKRTILTVSSLSLSLILLNSVYTLATAFDMDTYAEKFSVADFQIGNAKYFGMDHYWGANESSVEEESLSESFVSFCEAQEGFQEGGNLYGRMNLGLIKESWSVPKNIAVNEKGQLGWYWNGEVMPFNETRQGDYQVFLHGMEDFWYQKLDIYQGEQDLEMIKDKLASGKYLLVEARTDDNGVVEKEELKHEVGDKIMLREEDGTEREFEILSLIKSDYYGLTNRTGAEFRYYTSAKVFQEMSSDKFLMCYAFDVEEGKADKIERNLSAYTQQTEIQMDYESRKEKTDEFNQLTGMFLLIGGILAAVTAVVGILNFSNAMLTGILSRRREFAVMGAVGMTKKQLMKMLVMEGVCYAGFTIVVSFFVGCLMSVTLVRALANGMWFMKYSFTMVPMLMVFPVILLLGAIIPYLIYRFQKKESITEQIRGTD